MRTNPSFIRLFSFLITLFIASACELPTFAQSESTNGDNTVEGQIVAALKIGIDPHYLQMPSKDLQNLFQAESLHRKHIIQELIQILDDPKSHNGTKRFAASFLGELHAVEAVDSLAAQITLTLPGTLPGTESEMESVMKLPWNNAPAYFALEKIGAASIPALIRNVSGSDDERTRDLSLRLLVRIDGDIDISQLRLQKALKAETDSQRQTKLQAALTALPEMPL
jgi:hypothetical protein